jgi:hypothetical protein
LDCPAKYQAQRNTEADTANDVNGIVSLHVHAAPSHAGGANKANGYS